MNKNSTKQDINLISLIERYHDEDKCRAYLEELRWPNGVACPRCGSVSISRIEKPRVFDCNSCRYQFSVTAGTIFHDSHLPLWKWFATMYLMIESKKGISANQVKRTIGVSYKTAWYLCHRIRSAMSDGSPSLLKGIVEVDETYVGGKHKGGPGRGSSNKVPVVGMKERTSGKVRMKAVRNVSSSTLKHFIRGGIEIGAEVHTDEFPSYLWIDSSEFTHRAVNHQETYVDGKVHTNGVENVWSLFKRGIVGVYHKVSAKYLPLYLNEFSYRFNGRGEFNLMDRVLQTSF